jgi:NADPH:quinone reductase-like Zn-dependent oxidoreductase
MKAAVVTRYGPPEVVELKEVPAPVPKDDEATTAVLFLAVCYGDRIIRQGPLLVRLMGGWRRPKARRFSASTWRARWNPSARG